ncbi:glycosyltransferase 87 family protein [Nitrospirillum sp. BR 11828]|uniref:glycosyltransferase 87 family protein n=1 Tax=Nitrospirillum sp. BR 11828 TaxID=3104325 RepID=UPI002ACABD43|nr:glycosyltransferase 87 family protein [Nitrospirillum sp. BR 11828]MDZ5650562.1 glycosyltransferase 87 family protein [Nitrospirillum sp. BR 11828]
MSRPPAFRLARPLAIGLALWAIALVAIEAQVISGRFVSEFHIYAEATWAWWRGAEIYEDGINGFLYLPSSAVLFTPWAYLPPLLGDALWRLSLLAACWWGVARLCRLLAPVDWQRVFGVALLAALPIGVVDLRGAQTEFLMLGLMLGGLADIAEGRWRRAAFLLVLAGAFKPQALALVLLAFALWPALRLHLALWLAAALVLPLAHWNPGYALGEYGQLVRKTMSSANPGGGVWHDFANGLATLGLPLDLAVQTAIRALAGGAVLVLARGTVSRLPAPRAGATVAALIVTYLLLFNPRTVLGHFGDMALVAGAFAGWEFHARRNRALGWVLVLLCFALTTHVWTRGLHQATTTWFKPLLACGFGLYVVLRWVPSLTDPTRPDSDTAGEGLATQS